MKMNESLSQSGYKLKTNLFILAGLLILFIVNAALTLTGVLAVFEGSVYNSLARLISPALTTFMKIVTYGGSFPLLCGLALLFILIPPARKKYGFPAAVTLGISALANIILKQIFRRERPDILRLVPESGFSFPSGHTQSSTAFFIAAALILLFNVKDKRVLIPAFIICVIIPLMVGLSRIYLGVHYAGDVIEGWATGSIIAIAVNIVWAILDIKLRNKEKIHKFLFEDKVKRTSDS